MGWGGGAEGKVCTQTSQAGQPAAQSSKQSAQAAPGLLMVMAQAAGLRPWVNARLNHFSTRSRFSKRRACSQAGVRGGELTGVRVQQHQHCTWHTELRTGLPGADAAPAARGPGH